VPPDRYCDSAHLQSLHVVRDTGATLENFTTFFGPRWIYKYRGFRSDAPIEGGGDATFQFQLRGLGAERPDPSRFCPLRSRILYRHRDLARRSLRSAGRAHGLGGQLSPTARPFSRSTPRSISSSARFR
jgi:hypothetical protein